MDYLNNIEIGERIRSLREQMSLNREKFSELIDISEVFLGQIERGECSLSLKTLSRIIYHTGTSADYILYGKESDNSNIRKINRILNRCSNEKQELAYTIINDIYRFNENKKK